MRCSRRQFSALVSGLVAAPAFAIAGGNEEVSSLFLSAASDGDDKHWVIGFRQAGEKIIQVFKHQLPARAHHIAIHEGTGIYAVIARRPGRYLFLGDLDSGNRLAEINVPDDRHLYGHGVFSSDGSHFYTAESAWQFINGDSGRVVVWDVSREGQTISIQRTAEYPSYGIGPHELLLKNDSTLVIANGGIRTHPDRGREKLNIESMQPSLAYINAGNGNLEEQHFLDAEYHQASIRHMDINDAGQVAIGLQYEGEPFDRVPLVVLHERGGPLKPLWAPEPQQGQMKQYVGSVRFDTHGRYFAASCPRGNIITFWDADSGELVNSLRSRDGCGICAYEGGFLYTAGTGRISFYDPSDDTISELDTTETGKVFWDNHLTRMLRA